jgi:two-component system response regulator CpxR
VQPKSLLIIDDDKELAKLLDEYLSPQGFMIDLAHDGLEGLKMATGSKAYDLILLDVMLPELDGFEVLKKLRLTHLTPILMLTAKGDDFDRIFGLELGADDYLPKPFNHRELSARVKALVRRAEYTQQSLNIQPLTIGGLTLNPADQTANYQEQELMLTATEFALLKLFMQNVAVVVSKELISEQVLGRRLAAFDRSIDMHVSNLRRKLSEYCGEDPIKTVRGAGYLFKVLEGI